MKYLKPQNWRSWMNSVTICLGKIDLEKSEFDLTGSR
jgi:hypothetical protein